MNFYRPSNVLKRVVECCVLNGGIFWLSIIFFEHAMLPLVSFLLNTLFGQQSGTGTLIWSWMQPVLSILFNMIWVLPLFLLSRFVNSLWFQVCIQKKTNNKSDKHILKPIFFFCL